MDPDDQSCGSNYRSSESYGEISSAKCAHTLTLSPPPSTQFQVLAELHRSALTVQNIVHTVQNIIQTVQSTLTLVLRWFSGTKRARLKGENILVLSLSLFHPTDQYWPRYIDWRIWFNPLCSVWQITPLSPPTFDVLWFRPSKWVEKMRIHFLYHLVQSDRKSVHNFVS